MAMVDRTALILMWLKIHGIMPQCQDCLYWSEIEDAPSAPKMGSCERYPPQFKVLDKLDVFNTYETPETPPEGFCGEWVQRPE